MRRRALLRAVLAAALPPAARAGEVDGSGLAGLLSSAPDGFARALRPRRFVFPADYGPHPRFRTEWWYFNGNVATGGGRPFGFELVFFRFALTPRPPRRASAWAAYQLYMAHFAVTDVAAGRFHAYERISRAGPGMAGAVTPFHVWLDDWEASGTAPDGFPLHLHARTAHTGIDLVAGRGKPPVLQGDAGLSRKSAQPGNASYYYSLTRMPLRGRIRADGAHYEVYGYGWLDREWSSSQLAPDEVGWDWFALQLDDDRELMFYRLRRRDGTVDPASAGSLVAPDGSATELGRDDVELTVLGHWRAPDGAAVYPSRWRLRVPRAGLDLLVNPVLADQELRLRLRYWEGAVRVSGSAATRHVGGRGYVELTGYARGGVTVPR